MHCQQKSGSSSTPPTPGYTLYPSFPVRQGLANLDHVGQDGMVWYHYLKFDMVGRLVGSLVFNITGYIVTMEWRLIKL